MKKLAETLTIDIGSANLVVEKYEDVEFIIYFQDKKTNCITQDIVTVRQALKDGELLQNSVDCLVWADENDESYTHRFAINRFVEKIQQP